MTEPQQVAEARRVVVAYLNGELDQVPAAHLELLVAWDPGFLDALGGVAMFEAGRESSTCLSPGIQAAFAEDPARAAELFPSAAAHIKACASCRFEIDALHSVIAAEAPAWERFALELDDEGGDLLVLGPGNWFLADRATLENTGEVGGKPVQVGVWSFEAIAPRNFALAQPKDRLVGFWPALNGAAHL